MLYQFVLLSILFVVNINYDAVIKRWNYFLPCAYRPHTHTLSLFRKHYTTVRK